MSGVDMLNHKLAKPVRPDRGPGAQPFAIRSVIVRGVMALADIAFEVAAAAPEQGQWIVLLGENGVGKSTLLRSLALALRPWSQIHPPLRADPSSYDPRATIEVVMAGSASPTSTQTRTVRPFALAATSDGWESEVDYFAYGSSRGTALGGPDRDVPFNEIGADETLFKSSARLVHAETWLRREALRAASDPTARRFFEAVLKTLSRLLPGDEEILIEADEFFFAASGGKNYRFSDASDGYLTTLGWTVDLIARWAHRYRESGKLDENFAKDMPCVVLVDELDLHLHPRWQLDIIPRLRKAFPKTTFVVTTHNPLTLQGTRPGEVFVLHRDEETGQVAIVQRDVPPGTDANRLLTGDWFGLPSTLDESSLRKLDEHRQMLLARRPESDPDRLRLEQELRQRLNGFADTSTERIAHGVVAELLDAKLRARRDITTADRQRVIVEVQRRLAALDAPAFAAREERAPYGTARPTAKHGGKAPPKKATKPADKRAMPRAAKPPAKRR